MNETTDETVEIRQITGETLNLIIDFVYENQIELDETNIFEVLRAADQLQVLDLIDLCERFLMAKISFVNVLSFRRVANFYCRKEFIFRFNFYLISFRLSDTEASRRILSSVNRSLLPLKSS